MFVTNPHWQKRCHKIHASRHKETIMSIMSTYYFIFTDLCRHIPPRVTGSAWSRSCPPCCCTRCPSSGRGRPTRRSGGRTWDQCWAGDIKLKIVTWCKSCRGIVSLLSLSRFSPGSWSCWIFDKVFDRRATSSTAPGWHFWCNLRIWVSSSHPWRHCQYLPQTGRLTRLDLLWSPRHHPPQSPLTCHHHHTSQLSQLSHWVRCHLKSSGLSGDPGTSLAAILSLSAADVSSWPGSEDPLQFTEMMNYFSEQNQHSFLVACHGSFLSPNLFTSSVVLITDRVVCITKSNTNVLICIGVTVPHCGSLMMSLMFPDVSRHPFQSGSAVVTRIWR